jgi:hypothetical protein
MLEVLSCKTNMYCIFTTAAYGIPQMFASSTDKAVTPDEHTLQHSERRKELLFVGDKFAQFYPSFPSLKIYRKAV